MRLSNCLIESSLPREAPACEQRASWQGNKTSEMLEKRKCCCPVQLNNSHRPGWCPSREILPSQQEFWNTWVKLPREQPWSIAVPLKHWHASREPLDRVTRLQKCWKRETVAVSSNWTTFSAGLRAKSFLTQQRQKSFLIYSIALTDLAKGCLPLQHSTVLKNWKTVSVLSLSKRAKSLLTRQWNFFNH